MKNLTLLVFLVLSTNLFAQNGKDNNNYSIFNTGEKEFFITTNSGVLNTPIGLKIGYLSKPGFYLGLRYGRGQVYHADSDLTTSNTNLFSITTGISTPLVIQNDFKLVAQLGAGYGEWWDFRWEGWTKSGFEIEAGLMIKKKNFIFNLTGNVLNGDGTYATGDICAGIGFVMNNSRK